MTITQEHLNLISHIYDTAWDQTVWPSVLDAIVRQCGACGSAIGLSDIHGPKTQMREVEMEMVSSIYSKEDQEEYNRRFRSDDLEAYLALLDRPPYQMFRDSELFSGPTPAAELPANNFLRERFGIGHRSAGRVNTDGAWIGVLVMQNLESHGPLTPAQAEIANIFLPHIAKALELSRPFLVLRSRFQAVLAALDRFHVGVFILSRDGHVILKNYEATRIIDLDDGLVVDTSGRFGCSQDAVQDELRHATFKAVATAHAQNEKSGTLLTIPRPSHADPFLVDVIPVNDHDGDFGSGFTGALALVIDPMRTDVISTLGLEAIYGLTEAEAETCRLVAEGLSTEEVAGTRNISPETVRSHIKRIYEKTRTNNRARLVRLALTVNLPIDPKDKS